MFFFCLSQFWLVGSNQHVWSSRGARRVAQAQGTSTRSAAYVGPRLRHQSKFSRVRLIFLTCGAAVVDSLKSAFPPNGRLDKSTFRNVHRSRIDAAGKRNKRARIPPIQAVR